MIPGRLTAAAGLVSALGFALLLRLHFAAPALEGARPFHGDEGDYYGLATSLLAEGSFSVSGQSSAYRLPAFPILLAAFQAFDGRPFAAIPGMVGLGLLTCAGTYLVARQLFGPRPAAVAIVLAAADISLAWYSGHLYSENLYVPLVLFAFWGLVEARRRGSLPLVGLAGVLGGLALLARSNFVPLAPVAILWAYFAWPRAGRRALLAAALLALTIALVWAPWGIRNALAFGRLLVTTSQPCPPCVGIYHDAAFDLSNPQTFARWQPTTTPAGLTELAAGAYRRDRAIQWIREHPVPAAIIAVAQAPQFWRPAGLEAHPFVPLVWLGYLLLLIAAAYGTRLALRQPGRRDLALWLGAAAALTAFSVLTIGDPRHRLVLHPLLNALAALAIVQAATTFRRAHLPAPATAP